MDWEIPKEEMDLCAAIANRALTTAKELNIKYDATTALMDIVGCHRNGCPLELQALLEAETFDFVHDVFGIRRHINRNTGHLENGFLPRCAKRQEALNEESEEG